MTHPLPSGTSNGSPARSQCLIPFAGTCDLGQNIAGQPITDALGHALVQTLTLVTGATVLAILIGITLGHHRRPASTARWTTA